MMRPQQQNQRMPGKDGAKISTLSAALKVQQSIHPVDVNKTAVQQQPKNDM